MGGGAGVRRWRPHEVERDRLLAVHQAHREHRVAPRLRRLRAGGARLLRERELDLVRLRG